MASFAWETCPRCHGGGTVSETYLGRHLTVKCPECGGSGQVCKIDTRDHSVDTNTSTKNPGPSVPQTKEQLQASYVQSRARSELARKALLEAILSSMLPPEALYRVHTAIEKLNCDDRKGDVILDSLRAELRNHLSHTDPLFSKLEELKSACFAAQHYKVLSAHAR